MCDDEPDSVIAWEEAVAEAERRSLEALRSREASIEYSGAPDHEEDDA